MRLASAERSGGHLAEAGMGPLGAIGLEPRLGDLAHLLEGVEEIDVENLQHRGRGRIDRRQP